MLALIRISLNDNLSLSKSILSFQLLFVLLLPRIEQGIHYCEHNEKTHCTDNTSNHLHEVIHECKLCDLFAQSTVEFFLDQEIQVDAIVSNFAILHIPDFIHDRTSVVKFLRGPPAVV
ncbi:MAG: hypothetical protein ABI844_04440 [Saprospiraceae bacterium]